MKRFVIIFLLSIPLFSDELNWERVNSCPVGNMAFVEEVLSEMTLEEKVGQTSASFFVKRIQQKLFGLCRHLINKRSQKGGAFLVMIP